MHGMKETVDRIQLAVEKKEKILIFGDYDADGVSSTSVMIYVGILVSFVTAVFGARILLGLWVNSRALNKKYWLFGVKEEQIDEL